MRKAEEAGDVDAWLIAIRARYARAKARNASATELQNLRNFVRGRIDCLRSGSRSRMLRLCIAQNVESLIGELFRDYVAEGKIGIGEYFELIESGKSRTLLDHISLGYKELSAGDAKDRANEIEHEMMQFPPYGDISPVHRELMLSSQFYIAAGDQAALTELESLYAQANAGFSGTQPICTVSEIQRALRPREVFIDYFIPYHPLHPARELHAIIVTMHDVRFYSRNLTSLDHGGRNGLVGTVTVDDKQPIQTTPLGQMVVMARLEIQRGDDHSAEMWLQRLYALLIEPLGKQGVNVADYDRWIIAPHRLLHPIPWGALCGKNGRRLIEDIAICLVPSASIWLELSRRPMSFPRTCLALGNPVPLPYKLPALPEAQAEVELIGEILAGKVNCTILAKEQATERALQQVLGGHNLVHFATHGMFPEQNPLDFHELLLGMADGCDGRVRAEELRNMDFRAASLVVLSICNGGIYRFGPGDEAYGLTSALLAAGATNLVGTLWSINDRKGRQFMTRFYSDLLEHGPAESLRLTCCEFAAQGWALKDWAAFLALGPAGPFA